MEKACSERSASSSRRWTKSSPVKAGNDAERLPSTVADAASAQENIDAGDGVNDARSGCVIGNEDPALVAFRFGLGAIFDWVLGILNEPGNESCNSLFRPRGGGLSANELVDRSLDWVSVNGSAMEDVEIECRALPCVAATEGLIGACMIQGFVLN